MEKISAKKRVGVLNVGQVVGVIIGMLIVIGVLIATYKVLAAGASKTPQIANMAKTAVCKGEVLKMLSIC